MLYLLLVNTVPIPVQVTGLQFAEFSDILAAQGQLASNIAGEVVVGTRMHIGEEVKIGTLSEDMFLC